MAASSIGLGAQANGYNIRADVLSGLQHARANTRVAWRDSVLCEPLTFRFITKAAAAAIMSTRASMKRL